MAHKETSMDTPTTPTHDYTAETIDIAVAGRWNAGHTTYRVKVWRPSTGDGLTAVLTELLIIDVPDAFKYAVENAIDKLCFGNPHFMSVLHMIPSPPPAKPFSLCLPVIPHFDTLQMR